MSQGKQTDLKRGMPSLEEAVLDGDWDAAHLALTLKLARAFDHTDSYREVKAIAHELVPIIDDYRRDAHAMAAQDEEAETPLGQAHEMAAEIAAQTATYPDG